MSFTVLTVCTGNICRSPAAEYLLRDALGPSVTVASAGTGALAGHGVEAQMAALLPMDCSGFVARQLTPALVRDADLVLGLTRSHRSRAVEMFPAAVRSAFTLRELARILQLPEVPPPARPPSQALRELAPWAARARVRARALDPADDDIDDPYRQSDEVFATIHSQIATAVRAIGAAVRA